jgi:hypothetical protein
MKVFKHRNVQMSEGVFGVKDCFVPQLLHFFKKQTNKQTGPDITRTPTGAAASLTAVAMQIKFYKSRFSITQNLSGY